MTHVESTKTIVATNVGRPDYTGEQWQAKTSSRYELRENEALKSFAICGSTIVSPYPWVVSPIVVGVKTALIDTDTGLAMPYTVPAGYELELLQFEGGASQNARTYFYVDGFFLQHLYFGGLDTFFFQNVTGFTTKDIDPTFSSSHTIEVDVENLGIDTATGLAEIDWILRRHHTEVPTSKTIRCKWCGNITTVPFDTTSCKCLKCGKLTLYFTKSQYMISRKVK